MQQVAHHLRRLEHDLGRQLAHVEQALVVGLVPGGVVPGVVAQPDGVEAHGAVAKVDGDLVGLDRHERQRRAAQCGILEQGPELGQFGHLEAGLLAGVVPVPDGEGVLGVRLGLEGCRLAGGHRPALEAKGPHRRW